MFGSIILMVHLTALLLDADLPVLNGSRISMVHENTWRHDIFLRGRLFAVTIDRKGDLIAQFQMDHTFNANKERFEQFRPVGEGPDDLASCFGITKVGENLGIIDHYGKIKIFHETEKGYRGKKTVYRKNEPNHHFVEDLIFIRGKWYIGGMTFIQEGNEIFTQHIKVYDENGVYEDALLRLPIKAGRAAQFMESYLRLHDGNLYFMREQDMVVHVLSAKTNEVLKEQRLKPPGYYISLPDDYFLYQDLKKPNLNELIIDWRMNYTRVEQMAVHNGHLIVQLRTAQPDKPIYDLRFYDLNTFDLVDNILTDSFLVTTEGDQLYFLRNGMPGHDDDAGEFILDIYRLADKRTEL